MDNAIDQEKGVALAASVTEKLLRIPRLAKVGRELTRVIGEKVKGDWTGTGATGRRDGSGRLAKGCEQCFFPRCDDVQIVDRDDPVSGKRVR